MFLESAVPLTKSLQRDIVTLGKRLEAAAAAEEDNSTRPSWDIRGATRQHEEIKSIIAEVKSLLARIDRDIPLIQLAISASGETMANSMPPGVSPSRLMQASTLLSIGDTQFASDPTRPVQIGPSFTVSCYMLFVGHSGKAPNGTNRHGADHQQPGTQAYGLGEGQRKPIWQEVMHKARVRLCRTPAGWRFDREMGYCRDPDAKLDNTTSSAGFSRDDEYTYHLEMIEDLDDGRLHEDGTAGTEDYTPYDDISMAGIRESIPVHQIAKIFYTDTGKILNIGNAEDGENNPVLLLKRDVTAATHTELRRQWEQEAAPHTGEEEELKDIPVIQPTSSALSDTDTEEDEQSAMDRQLGLESEVLASAPPQDCRRHCREEKWQFPPHVDPEWIALEVYTEPLEETEGDTDGDTGEDDSDVGSIAGFPEQLAVAKTRSLKRNTPSVDSNLLD